MMETRQDTRVMMDSISLAYQEMKGDIITDEEALKIDRTQDFFSSLRTRVRRGMSIRITINGWSGTGKSVSGLSIAKKIAKFIEEVRLNNNINIYDYISQDQTEMIRAIRELKNIPYVVDENNRLSRGGFNASVETDLFGHICDVHGQKGVHFILCAVNPNYSQDNVSQFKLEPIGWNYNTKVNTFKLSYREPGRNFCVLGSLPIYVGDIIEDPRYKHYVKKKFSRMDLLDKYGVRDIRELEMSRVTLIALESLKVFETAPVKMPLEVVSLKVKNVLQKEKLIYSMLGSTEIDQRVRGLLNIKIMTNKYKSALSKPMEEEKRKEIEKLVNSLEKETEELLEAERRNVRILEEYYKIL
jgi:hypothetical protein